MDVIFIKIQPYFEICTGTKIKKADKLSRRLDWKIGIERTTRH